LAAALRFDADERELDPDERELAVERLRVLEDERLPDAPAFFPPPELPLPPRSAICSPSWVPADCAWESSPETGTISPRRSQ
jgi:hypothetical protein